MKNQTIDTQNALRLIEQGLTFDTIAKKLKTTERALSVHLNNGNGISFRKIRPMMRDGMSAEHIYNRYFRKAKASMEVDDADEKGEVVELLRKLNRKMDTLISLWSPKENKLEGDRSPGDKWTISEEDQIIRLYEEDPGYGLSTRIYNTVNGHSKPSIRAKLIRMKKEGRLPHKEESDMQVA